MFDWVLKRLSILKNRMKNVENKAMLKSITVINVKWPSCRVSQKELANFYEYFDLNYLFGNSITLNRKIY